MVILQAAPIVITGVGLASPLGRSAQETWENVLANRCGIAIAPAMDGPIPAGKDAGQCEDLPIDFSPQLPRAARYLRWTMQQALTAAGAIEQLPCAPGRATVMLGTTLHGMRAGGHFLRTGDFRQLNQFLAGDVLAAAVGNWPLLGGRMTTCSACSSSLGSIALGVTLLQSGAADLVVAGGYDPISEYAWAGFNSLRLVSDPPLRPFTRGRVGMKVSESYAIVILERAADAERRGTKAFATVAGWGESADAHHLTQPHPAGDGALRAMRDAVQRAHISPQELGLIAAHATGTPDNDAAEHAALSQLLQSQLQAVPVVGFKSHLGHTLGGAGAAELILAGCALRDQTIPPTANIDTTTIEYPNVHLQSSASSNALHYTLNTSLGFGGANTSVVLARTFAVLPVPTPVPARQSCQVVITGVGILLPGVVGKEAFAQQLQFATPFHAGAIEETSYESLLAARRVRRMSTYVKMTLAAVALACADGGLIDPATYADETAGLLGTMHGSAGYCRAYYEQVVREGATAANPLLFAEGVPNAAAAQLSLMLGLKQSCQTLLGTRTSGLDALRLAALRIAAGDWQRAIVSAADEYDDTINTVYTQCGLRRGETNDGFVNSAGAVAFVVESADAAAARGAAPLATITRASAASGDRKSIIETIGQLAGEFAGEPMITAPSAGTWLARAEQAGLHQAGISPRHITALPELFSATPLAALAAALSAPPGKSFATLACDFSGLATVVRCEVP